MKASEVTVANLSKVFGEPPVPALEGIDFGARPGAITAVVGASGSGKSTLLRIIGALTEATSGAVSIGGRSPGEVLAAKEVGWMAQRPALLPWRRVIENVSLAQTINPQPDRPLEDPARLLAMVGLARWEDAYPASLSGGMQQRVALARTMAIGAPLWLMDEPFASLDELTREALTADLLRIWGDLRPTVIWVTHHIPEAVELADRIVILTPSPGRLAGLVEVDLPRPRDPTTLEFQDVVREVRAVLRRIKAEVPA